MTLRLEKDIERAVGQKITLWAREQGIPLLYLKLSAQGERGWPDRTILWGDAKALFIEFKRPGEEPRKLQKYIHEAIRNLGFEVQVHDDIERAVAAIQAQISATTPADPGD